MSRFVRETRRRLWPVIDEGLARIGGYATATLPSDGYVGSAECHIREFEDELVEMGFSFGMVAALKDRVCPAGEEVEAGSWVRRDHRFAHDQLHVHLFDGVGDEYTDVYAHHEASWVRSPLEHYRRRTTDHERGVEMLREIVQDCDVELVDRDLEERCQI